MNITIKYPMTEEQKQEWVNALRSGKYKQGKGELHSKNQHGDHYCCLGVAREIFPEIKRFVNVDDTLTQSVNSVDKFCFLPINIQEYLAKMNDDGFSFEEIADFIEENIHVDDI